MHKVRKKRPIHSFFFVDLPSPIFGFHKRYLQRDFSMIFLSLNFKVEIGNFRNTFILPNWAKYI